MSWWNERWIQPTVDGLIDSFEGNGRADLNVEFCAAIPLLTICGSFGISADDALDVRAALHESAQGIGVTRFMGHLRPIVEARRAEPQDDLISTLVRAELTDEHGARHVLSDSDVMAFSYLLLLVRIRQSSRPS